MLLPLIGGVTVSSNPSSIFLLGQQFWVGGEHGERPVDPMVMGHFNTCLSSETLDLKQCWLETHGSG